MPRTFATEEDRQAEVGKINWEDGNPDNEKLFDELTSATIGPEPTPPATTGDPAPVTEHEPAPAPATEGALSPEEISVLDEDGKTVLGKYKNQNEVLKALRETKKLADAQGKRLREHNATADPTRDQKIAELQAQLKELQAKSGTAAPGAPAPAKVENVSEEIAAAEAEEAELLKEMSALEASVEAGDYYEADYQKKVLALNRKIITNSARIRKATSAAQAIIQKQNETIEANGRQVSEFLGAKQKEEDERATKESFRDLDRQFDEVAALDPMYKTTKGTMESDQEYREWVEAVASALFKKPVSMLFQGTDGKMYRTQEADLAMQQLQLRHPALLEDLRLAGIASEPTADMKAYLARCELDKYRRGFRIDPSTGKWSTEPLWSDPVNKIPFVIPTQKQALEMMRLDTGYYKETAEKARQRSGDYLQRAMDTRDRGATEPRDGSLSGQLSLSEDAAAKILTPGADGFISAEEAAKSFRAGDRGPHDRLNAALKVCGLPEITDDDM